MSMTPEAGDQPRHPLAVKVNPEGTQVACRVPYDGPEGQQWFVLDFSGLGLETLVARLSTDAAVADWTTVHGNP